MNKKIILLAEDDDSIQLVTSEFLSGEGYDIRSAKTLIRFVSVTSCGAGSTVQTNRERARVASRALHRALYIELRVTFSLTNRIISVCILQDCS